MYIILLHQSMFMWVPLKEIHFVSNHICNPQGTITVWRNGYISWLPHSISSNTLNLFAILIGKYHLSTTISQYPTTNSIVHKTINEYSPWMSDGTNKAIVFIIHINPWRIACYVDIAISIKQNLTSISIWWWDPDGTNWLHIPFIYSKNSCFPFCDIYPWSIFSSD